MNSVLTEIGSMAEAGEKMIERLRRKAFLPDARKALNVRLGIAEVAQLLGCSTNRIRMAEDDGRLPLLRPARTAVGLAIPWKS
jgi:chromosome partitioning protein